MAQTELLPLLVIAITTVVLRGESLDNATATDLTMTTTPAIQSNDTEAAATGTLSVLLGNGTEPTETVTATTPDWEVSSDMSGQELMERFYRRYNTTKEVDLVFVLDRSGSVPRKGWYSIVEFVKVCIEHVCFSVRTPKGIR